MRCKKPSGNDVWHLDEVVITIYGRRQRVWRAVEQDGYVLDEIIQNRRNTKADRRLSTHLLKKQGIAPKRMITDKLRSYGAARRQIMSRVEHRSHKGLNDRAESSHVPLRKRERMMQGLRSPGGLQRFVSPPRPTPLQTLRIPNPGSPHPGDRRVESCSRGHGLR